MILQRIINTNVSARIRQFDALSRSVQLGNMSGSMPPIRTSVNLAYVKYSAKSFPSVEPAKQRLFNNTLLKSVSLAPQTRMASTTQGDHVRLWVFERVVSAALPLLIPAALVLEKPVLDGILAVLISIHTHWGLEAIVIDYVRPIVFGPLLPKLALIALNVLTATVLAGLLVLIYNGPGISKSIKNAWAIGKKGSSTN